MPRRKRVDLSKLNPYDAPDMAVIDAEWRRMQARKQRRATRLGWLRVVIVCLVYLGLAWVVIGIVYLIAVLLLALFG